MSHSMNNQRYAMHGLTLNSRNLGRLTNTLRQMTKESKGTQLRDFWKGERMARDLSMEMTTTM